MPISRGSNRFLLAGMVAIALTIITFSITLFSLEARARAVERIELRFEATAQELLFTVGFDGLIHHFKNCVLRGARLPDNCDRAEAHAARSLTLLDELGELATAGSVALDGEPIRRMIIAYGSRVAEVRAGHAAGLTVAQIDLAVQWDDDPGAAALAEVIEATRTQLSLNIARLHRDTLVQYALAILLLLLICGGLAFMLYRDNRLAHRRERQLAAVFSGVAGGLVAFDANGQVALANSAARDMLDLPTDPAPFSLPAHIRLDWAAGEPEPASAAPIELARQGSAIHEELCNLTLAAPSSRPARLLRINIAPLHLPELDLRSVLTFEDVSEQEQQRKRIERITRFDALGQLTGGIAHDFNNHLATILFAVDLALDEEQSENSRAVLESAARAVAGGRNLTDRLLTFASRNPGNPQSEDITVVFDNLAPLARASLPPDIKTEITVESPDLRVHCDLSQLENALLNLVINARDAILSHQQKGLIRVHARSVTLPGNRLSERQSGVAPNAGEIHRYVEISVTDDGPGMSDEVRQRATDPFFTTKPEGEGTGLGLAMAFGFARQARGDLSIYSESGLGTAVRLVLPRASATDNRREKPVATPVKLAAQGETILLVEDDAELRLTMNIMLEDLGYRIEAAAGAEEALAILQRGTPVDLVLSDVVMPGALNGQELAVELDRRYPGLPVVLMSGYAGLKQVENLTEAPPILRKPCMPSELSEALRRALESK